jgi:hypothetical protein
MNKAKQHELRERQSWIDHDNELMVEGTAEDIAEASYQLDRVRTKRLKVVREEIDESKVDERLRELYEKNKSKSLMVLEYFWEAGVPENELYDCYSWAFGEDYLSILSMEIADRWRERHGNLFYIYDVDDFRDSMIRIGRAYLNRAGKNVTA